ncbi:MAG: hypothetical protein ABWZ98_02865 [Nakamurella sp.]
MFLSAPPPSDKARAFYDEDRESQGYVDNLTRLWCWRPELMEQFFSLRRTLAGGSGLSAVDLAVLNVAAAAACHSAYCALAKGIQLARLTDVQQATQVVSGVNDGLDPRSAALSRWAHRVVAHPAETTAADVDQLRAVGLNDQQIFSATLEIALRQAFATVNDALGAEPDQQLADRAPAALRAAVNYGRPPASAPST